MSGYISKTNGKKGGRPKGDCSNKIELQDINLVILTHGQYSSLLKKYGYEFIHEALNTLERWLQSSPEGEKYRGKNNYGHFRSDGWLINSVKIDNT